MTRARQLQLEPGDVILLWGIVDGFLIGKKGDWIRARRILSDLSEMMEEVSETNRKPETGMGSK